MKERNDIQRKLKPKQPGETNQLESQNPKDSDAGGNGYQHGSEFWAGLKTEGLVEH